MTEPTDLDKIRDRRKRGVTWMEDGCPPADVDEPNGARATWIVLTRDVPALLDLVARLTAELAEARTELGHWQSGRRTKGLPTVESVPDALHYAAELVRAQGTEGGEDHDRLLVAAGMRLKAIHDAAAHLLREAVVNRAELAEAQRERDEARATAERWRRLAVDLTRCEHGRVQGDVCASCPDRTSPSQYGRALGHSLDGTYLVVVPPRDVQADPDAWYQLTAVDSYRNTTPKEQQP